MTENKTRPKLSAKHSKDARGMSEKWNPKVTVSRSRPLIATPAHRDRWKRMEADTKREYSWFGYDCCVEHLICVRDFQRTRHVLRNPFAVANNRTLRHE